MQPFFQQGRSLCLRMMLQGMMFTAHASSRWILDPLWGLVIVSPLAWLVFMVIRFLPPLLCVRGLLCFPIRCRKNHCRWLLAPLLKECLRQAGVPLQSTCCMVIGLSTTKVEMRIYFAVFISPTSSKWIPDPILGLIVAFIQLPYVSMNGAFTSNTIRAAFSYCVQQVRSYDYHHYLCLLHLPPDMRKAAFALRAFNIETARAMDVASDPKIGLMRLLWWQEAIDKIFASKPIEQPTARALSSVISEHKISKHWLKRSVEARINDANKDLDAIPETVTDLEKYAENTASTLLYMTLEAGGIKSTSADHAASHVGKASGLLLLLKSLPYHANHSRRIPFIPADVASKHGLLVTQGGRSGIKMENLDALPDAVFEVASVARAHLRKAQELAGSLPTEALPVLLPTVPAQVLLDSLQRCHFNIFDSRLSRGVLGIPPLWFQMKLNWHAWRQKY